MNKLITFLIRHKLGVKKNEPFKFRNQSEVSTVYAFVNDELLKLQVRIFGENDTGYLFLKKSNCSFNYLMSNKCFIKPMKHYQKVDSFNLYGYRKR